MFGQRVVVVVLVHGEESVCRLLSLNAARAECGWMQNVGFGGDVKIMLGLVVGMVGLKLGILSWTTLVTCSIVSSVTSGVRDKNHMFSVLFPVSGLWPHP